LQSVLAGGRVDDEERLVRRALELGLDDTVDLRELLHQVRLRVQAAGGVDNHHVAAVARGAPDRVVSDRGRVRPTLTADELRPRAFGPDLELLLCGGAERVGRGEYDRVAVPAQPVGELADRRCLPGAVHADDEQHAGIGAHGERAGIAEQRRELVRQRCVEIGEVLARLEPADELLLEPLPGRVVARVERRGGQLGCERTATLGQ
jgi:hypothetical protein